MAVLSDAERVALHAALMSEFSNDRETLGALTKAEFRTAINDIDSWIDANMTSLNAAIQQPARSTLTTKQKVRLFVAIVRRRWEIA